MRSAFFSLSIKVLEEADISAKKENDSYDIGRWTRV